MTDDADKSGDHPEVPPGCYNWGYCRGGILGMLLDLFTMFQPMS